MDTSEKPVVDHSSMALLIGGRKSVLYSQVTPEVWKRVLDDIYTHRIVRENPEMLFSRLGDLMSSERKPLGWNIPPKVTNFREAQGLGVNSWVLKCSLREHGNLPTRHGQLTYRGKQFLLLVPPKEEGFLSWAVLTITAKTVATKTNSGEDESRLSFDTGIIDSEIKWISPQLLLGIFEENPSIPLTLMTHAADADLYAENLRKKALDVSLFAFMFSQMERRIVVQ